MSARAAAATAFTALLVATASAARAQVPDEPWSFVLFPVPTYSSLEGLGATLVGGWWKSAPAGPIPGGAAISPGASISTSGTETLSLTYNNTGRVPGWRFLLIGSNERFHRAPYFGLGNDSRISDSLETANGGDSHYYRYSLTRTTALVGIQHRITGPVRLLVGARYRRYRADALGGAPTALGADLASGAASDTGGATGVEVRGGLIFDTRDEEASPVRGIYLEALGARALKGAGDLDYTRWAIAAAEFVPIRADAVLAFRQSAQLARGALPFYVAYERLTNWLPEDGFGGTTTLRQNIQGRWLGPNAAVASADLRYKYWDAALGLSPIRLWLVAHADVGRVWDRNQRFEVSGLHSGYGVGAIAQFGRASFFGVEVGWSPDAHIQFGSTATLGF